MRRIYSIIRKDYRNNNLGERDKFFDYLKSIQTKYPDSETGKLAFKYMIVWKILERDNASVVQLSNKALEQFNGQDKKLVLVGLALTYINTGEVTEARNILQTLRSKYDDDEKLAASLEFEIANVEQMIANGQYKPEGNARYTKIGTGVPQAIELIQNYPNPFNPSTTISYALPVQSDVQLIIYDIMGREVKTLVSSRQEAGYKEVVWDGRNNFNEQAASGIYICRLKATSLENLNVFEKSIKLVLIK